MNNYPPGHPTGIERGTNDVACQECGSVQAVDYENDRATNSGEWFGDLFCKDCGTEFSDDALLDSEPFEYDEVE